MVKKLFKQIFFTLLAFFLCLVTVICGQVTLSAFADTTDDPQTQYENTNVLNNLKGSTIGGKEFDLADYPHDDKGKPQVISFIEFCYSYYAEKQSDYALYVYIYNPQDTAFDMSTDRNKIQFTYGSKASYSKYTLQFINYSTEAGYEGRFWKFKVKLTTAERTSILKEVDEASRVYKVSGIELSIKNNVTDYPCGQTYTYKGYALGYGSELAQSDTLSCTVDGFDKYLTLDVHSTYYRPKGTNGEAYARDTLHSVYFAVPNAIIDEYGEMTAVHATWLNAMTTPIVVTGNKTVYDAILPFIGKTVDGGHFHYANDDNSPLKYALLAGDYNESASWNHASHGMAHISYNANTYFTNSKKNITDLQYLFLASSGDADNYTLPAETLVGSKADGVKGYFETYTEKYGGTLVNNRFSKALFESVADKFTDITISSDDKFTLTDEVISQTLWQKFVGGGYNVTNTNTYTVSAIKKVTKDDIKADKAETCRDLYIDESDYTEFKSYYDTATRKQETVYLFRYYQSDYTCYEAIEYERGKGDWTLIGTEFDYDYVDTNAYFMQMWVQLDFDIIDLTFTKNGVETVIPVIMSPMDIAADGAPPVITTKNGPNILAIILGIILALIIIWLLLKFCPIVIVVIGKIIIFPFKCLGKLFKSICVSAKRRRERRQEKKAQKKPKSKQPKPPDLNGNVTPEEVESYLDSIDWESVDWTELDGKNG